MWANRAILALMMSKLTLALGALLLVCSQAQAAEPMHAFALHGTPQYPANFTQFEYVNKDAPKGGSVRLGALGSFDTLNPFTLKGEAADGLALVYDTLMVSPLDEASTEYGLVAKSIELAADGLSVTFTLNEKAKFADGVAVKASDVVWSFNTLLSKGAPNYQAYYGDVAAAADVSEASAQKVKFTFKTAENRELPLILGQLPVIPEHAFKDRDFSATTLVLPVGSGPYEVASFEQGRSITYALREDYWAKDHPTQVGQNNIAQIRYEYYRDPDVQFEAFKAGDIDFRLEHAARNWATGYTFPALKDGRVIKEAVPNQIPMGMQGFVMNTRKPVFADLRVRQAIVQMLDFEWMNNNLFYGQYVRSRSYFSNSDLASTGVPQGAELALLTPYKDKLPPELFSQAVDIPTTKGDGNNREQMKKAVELLQQAGWGVQKGKMVNAKGEQLSFEILLVQQDLVRVAQPFAKALQRIGITANVRIVDSAQYINRVQAFDYDMIVAGIPQSLSPGNEQVYFWHSSSADRAGSYNFAGIKDNVVDELVAKIVAAKDRDALKAATQALDRVLLWGSYVVPHWHTNISRLAYSNKLQHPADMPPYGVGFPSIWWVKP